MPLIADDYKQLTLAKFANDAVVAAQIDTLWSLHDDKTPLELQYNYVLIEAIELLLGTSWQDVNWSGDGRSVSESDKTRNLLNLAQRADARIKELVALRIGVGTAVGVLTTRVPIASTPGLPDANSVDYGGSPNFPTSGGGRW